MGVMDTLINWIAPYLDPMNDFHIYADDINNVHSNSLQDFRKLVYQLAPGQALQQNTLISGKFANAINNSAMDFTQTELDLSELAMDINKLAQLTEDFAECVGNIMEAIAEASAELADDAVLTEITADVDIAAVAEGGFNPIADVLGLILTVIDGAILIDTLKNLADEIQRDVKDLQTDIHDLMMVTYPPTAPQPYSGTITPGWKQHPNPVDPNVLSFLENKYGGHFNANPQQYANFQQLMKELLQMGMTQQQVETIMDKLLATGCSPNDILLFLQGLLNSDGGYPDSPTPDQIVQRILSLSRGTENQPNLKQLVELYAQIANIPGASRLLERMMTASFGPSYNGYLYELQWCAAHKDKIARIEDVTQVDGQIKQAADVVMKSGPFTQGAIVDTKSYKASSLVAQTNDLLTQIQKDQKDYPGYPIVLVFDSKKLLDSNGHLLPGVDAVFQKLAAAGATVMTSPPDRVWEVGQDALPGPHTTPARLLQSGANVAAGAITSGQGQPQQLPPQEPPLELPPIQQ